MSRLERRLIRLNDQISKIEREEHIVAEELAVHRHLNDDAQRDAAVSEHPLDRADARDTAGDVARFERSLVELQGQRAKLEAKRAALLNRLG